MLNAIINFVLSFVPYNFVIVLGSNAVQAQGKNLADLRKARAEYYVGKVVKLSRNSKGYYFLNGQRAIIWNGRAYHPQVAFAYILAEITVAYSQKDRATVADWFKINNSIPENLLTFSKDIQEGAEIILKHSKECSLKHAQENH